jgi:hypothetical protein
MAKFIWNTWNTRRKFKSAVKSARKTAQKKNKHDEATRWLVLFKQAVAVEDKFDADDALEKVFDDILKTHFIWYELYGYELREMFELMDSFYEVLLEAHNEEGFLSDSEMEDVRQLWMDDGGLRIAASILCCKA